jgi:23S rRNA (pseudouridine1915-N3)-methyltransferase
VKVSCWAIAATDEPYLRTGIAHYVQRLSHYLSFEYRELDFKIKKPQTPELQKEAEKAEILKLLKPSDFLVLLDDKGKELTSASFADWLQKKFNDASGNIVFLIGSAYGFDREIYQRANMQLSLSKLTFTHQMVRLIFLEQLYRAMTILRNEKYHHE